MNKRTLKIQIRQYTQEGSFGKNIQKLSLFGSFTKGKATDQSDVDLLIQFKKPVGFFEFLGMEEALSKQLGRKVDLVTAKSLSPLLRESILNDAELIYEA